MKYFVTLKSATCRHPCLPIHPSVYIHEHHYVYPYTHQQYPRASLCPLLERLRQKKPKKSAKILSQQNFLVSVSVCAQPANESPLWISLVVPWLRVCLPMQGTPVQSLVQENPAYHGAAKPEHHSY